MAYPGGIKLELALLIDFGSTYTKVTAVDLQGEAILASGLSLTTVETDIMAGLNEALSHLEKQGVRGPFQHKLACSSAAGGLKLAAIGLVPELTAEAAKRAALGAGARVLGVYTRNLTMADGQELAAKEPDIILLAGGTDGGNLDSVLHNARILAQEVVGRAPVIYAGNKHGAEEAAAILGAAGIDVLITENVLPELNTLNIEPAREVIRRIFLEQITRAKGLQKAEGFVEQVLMPTPAAVLKAAQVLAQGTGEEAGWGDLLVVDVGGATTDVHSMAAGHPSKAGITIKGLPEPYAKRTVEGDLGMRCSALALYETAGEKELLQHFCRELPGAEEKDFASLVHRLTKEPGALPQNPVEEELEYAMARFAVETAVNRHAGSLEVFYTPFGASWVQQGKDLTQVKKVIGTGGVLVHHPRAREILKGVLFNQANPTILKPNNPTLYLDKSYSLAAMGLLAEIAPLAALRIMKKYLHQL